MRHYTFIEMLVVAVIVALAAALVTPRIVTSSRRMTVENALSSLRTAFSETAMRARACGQPFTLTLDLDGNCFRVKQSSERLDCDWRPAPLALRSGERDDGSVAGNVLTTVAEYAIPDAVEWRDLPDDAYDGKCVFRFYPDGEASGPQLAFEVRSERFLIIIDSVLGKGTIVYDR